MELVETSYDGGDVRRREISQLKSISVRWLRTTFRIIAGLLDYWHISLLVVNNDQQSSKWHSVRGRQRETIDSSVVICRPIGSTYNEPTYTEWSRKNAQSLMFRHFATVFSRITRFSPKCSEINYW